MCCLDRVGCQSCLATSSCVLKQQRSCCPAAGVAGGGVVVVRMPLNVVANTYCFHGGARYPTSSTRTRLLDGGSIALIRSLGSETPPLRRPASSPLPPLQPPVASRRSHTERAYYIPQRRPEEEARTSPGRVSGPPRPLHTSANLDTLYFFRTRRSRSTSTATRPPSSSSSFSNRQKKGSARARRS